MATTKKSATKKSGLKRTKKKPARPKRRRTFSSLELELIDSTLRSVDNNLADEVVGVLVRHSNHPMDPEEFSMRGILGKL